MASKWTRAGLPLLLVCGLLTGCTVDQYARMLIEQDTTYGKINQAMVGSSEQLVASKAVSAARRFTMADGTQIDVWVLKAATEAPARGTVLLLHGLCDSKVTYVRLGRLLATKGFDVVLPDLRAHGRSTGKFVTYGALEKQDQKTVMDTLLAEKAVAEPVYAFGASMGASVAILYAAMEPRVQGVMAVAPSRDMRITCRRFLTRNAILLDDLQFDKVIAKAGQIGDFRPSEASSLVEIARLRCPVLLVHGTLDVFVPFADSKELYDAAICPKEIELVPLAGHFGVIFAREGQIAEGMERVVSGRLKTTTQPAGETPPVTSNP